MNWDAIGAIGELVGSLAVVVTLAFLSVQLRQNTRAVKSSSWQAIQDSEQRFDMFVSQDYKLASIWIRGVENGLDSFEDPVERLQFLTAGKQLLDLYQTHHYQYEADMIDEEHWRSWVTQYEEETRRWPGFCEVIRERYPHLRPSFRAFVDERALNTNT